MPLLIADAGDAASLEAMCGVLVEEIEDPLMRKLRSLDKLIHELAKGKKRGSILRSP
jgi:hypothetical protein